MPELPEVETVRLGLCPRWKAAHSRGRDPARRFARALPPDSPAADRAEGVALRRRAKYLLAELDSGETLVIHLGMPGA